MAAMPCQREARRGVSHNSSPEMYASATSMDASTWLFRSSGHGAMRDDLAQISFTVIAPPIEAPIRSIEASLARCAFGLRRIPLRHAAMPQHIKPVVRGRTEISSGTINDQD